jgi:hypothetical protein
VLVNSTLIVSSFEYFRKLEAASELTVRGSCVMRENSPELETANKANIGLGMFRTFAEINGGTIDISGTRFIHTAPNLFCFSASVGDIDELAREMVTAHPRFEAV